MNKTQAEIKERIMEEGVWRMNKKSPYEQVEKSICELITELQKGAGLTDEIFARINQCIADIIAIDQKIHTTNVLTNDKAQEGKV